jgi:hypothetical protein
MRKSIAPEQIASAILVLRGQRVLLDAELAAGSSEPVARCGRFLEASQSAPQVLAVRSGEFFKVAICDLKDRSRPQS